ncbi:MAG TPA: hypothetical protein VKQ30_19285 [Ktedonobacterales bacterium]|nr:hypothetical protein [Ktedonobacterales bacterium]
MRGATTDSTYDPMTHPAVRRAVPQRARRAGHLDIPPVTFVTRAMPDAATLDGADVYTVPAPVRPGARRAPGIGAATALPALPIASWHTPHTAPANDPDVWLIALPLAGGSQRSLEGAGRAGAIRVSRPYGHLRSIRPVILDALGREIDSAASAASAPQPRQRRASSRENGRPAAGLGSATATKLPAPRPTPAIVSAVEVETDAGLFRVERRGSVLCHSDLAWTLANLEAGEPDAAVPLPRRQLALLLTLLPPPEDPAHPEDDPTWGWAHKLRGPWERGPLHARGRLGRLIAIDPDESGRGMHRACFELLGTEEIVWAVGVPCFRTGSVYELLPIAKGLNPSRWLTWPLSKGRKRAGAPERPTWEIARVVYRVGAPRWPLAGVVEPLGPMGVAG